MAKIGPKGGNADNRRGDASNARHRRPRIRGEAFRRLVSTEETQTVLGEVTAHFFRAPNRETALPYDRPY